MRMGTPNGSAGALFLAASAVAVVAGCEDPCIRGLVTLPQAQSEFYASVQVPQEEYVGVLWPQPYPSISIGFNYPFRIERSGRRLDVNVPWYGSPDRAPSPDREILGEYAGRWVAIGGKLSDRGGSQPPAFLLAATVRCVPDGYAGAAW